jgi:hypothetical protein
LFRRNTAKTTLCMKKGVIMGQIDSLYQEIPMRTPKPFYAQQRRIYHSELLTCPSCGDLLVGCNYLAWDKTVQTLDQVLSIASRPAHCARPTCPGFEMRLLSAHAAILILTW